MTRKRYIKLLMSHGISRNDSRSMAQNVQYYNEMYARENHREKTLGKRERHTIMVTYQFRWDTMRMLCNFLGEEVPCRINIRKEMNYAEKTD